MSVSRHTKEGGVFLSVHVGGMVLGQTKFVWARMTSYRSHIDKYLNEVNGIMRMKTKSEIRAKWCDARHERGQK